MTTKQIDAAVQYFKESNPSAFENNPRHGHMRHLKTLIDAALQQSKVEEVTVNEIANHVYEAWAYIPKGNGTRAEHANGVALFLLEAFPNGLKIVRGDGS